VLQENVLDGGLADLVPKVDEVIADSGVAPAQILLFEPNHEIDSHRFGFIARKG
jgi:hypothetical protein